MAVWFPIHTFPAYDPLTKDLPVLLRDEKRPELLVVGKWIDGAWRYSTETEEGFSPTHWYLPE